MDEQPSHPDPLARASQTRQIGRRLAAVAILTMLALSQPVFAVVDLVAAGWLPLWIVLVWLSAVVAVAASVEFRRDSADPNEGSTEAPS